MIFKTLNKALQEEGITLDLLNNISLVTGYSPVILKPGDEPAELLECAKGYWVKDPEGGYLKDAKGLFVVDAKEVQIGRARYLLKHGAAEKTKLVDALVTRWKMLIKDEMDRVYTGFNNLSGKETTSLYNILKDVDRQNRGLSEEEYEKENEAKAAMLLDHYSALKELWAANRFLELLSILDIKKFNNPMSFKRDSENDMLKLKQFASKSSIHSWGVDGIRHYAGLEINIKYPWLITFPYTLEEEQNV